MLSGSYLEKFFEFCIFMQYDSRPVLKILPQSMPVAQETLTLQALKRKGKKIRAETVKLLMVKTAHDETLAPALVPIATFCKNFQISNRTYFCSFQKNCSLRHAHRFYILNEFFANGKTYPGGSRNDNVLFYAKENL